MTTNRLNVSLINNDDKEAILKLRDKLEEKEGKRLSLAEVVRTAIHGHLETVSR